MSEQPHRADRTLDVTGLACPAPVIELQEFVQDLDPGMVVEVLADDGGIQWDLPAWCISHGHTLLALEETGRLWKGYVRLSRR